MTPNRPIQPPLRGLPVTVPTQEPVTPPQDPGCVILDRCCDQCGRRVSRPHVANARVYCGQCCPTCACAALRTRA